MRLWGVVILLSEDLQKYLNSSLPHPQFQVLEYLEKMKYATGCSVLAIFMITSQAWAIQVKLCSSVLYKMLLQACNNFCLSRPNWSVQRGKTHRIMTKIRRTPVLSNPDRNCKWVYYVIWLIFWKIIKPKFHLIQYRINIRIPLSITMLSQFHHSLFS